MATDTSPHQPKVDEHEAAAYLGLSVDTLRKDRQGERRFPFYKMGRTVRYDVQRLDEALAAMECGGPQPRRRPARSQAVPA
jgi:excisionase family DNA binding protein